MTLTTTHNRLAYVGNGSTTIFPYTFLILDDADLLIYHDDVLQTAGYTVSGVGTGSGGNVTYTTAPASEVAIVFLRATDQTQQVNLIEGDRLPADAVEGMFDKAYAAIQDVAERADRAVSVSPTSDSDAADLVLPDPSDPANQDKVVYINGSGALEARELVATDTIGNNPITTKGDLIQGSTSGTPERLGIGTTRQVLTVVSGQAAWQTPPGARIANTTAIAVPHATATVLPFDTFRYDDGFHSLATPSRVTIPLAGRYLIMVGVAFALRSDYTRLAVAITLNNFQNVTVTDLTLPFGSNSQWFALSTVYALAVGDYLEVTVVQSNTAGAATTILAAGATTPEFTIQYLGP